MSQKSKVNCIYLLVEEVKKKFNNLRTQLSRALKPPPSGASGEEAIQLTSWPYLNQLDFMRGHVEPRVIKGSVSRKRTRTGNSTTTASNTQDSEDTQQLLFVSSSINKFTTKRLASTPLGSNVPENTVQDIEANDLTLTDAEIDVPSTPIRSTAYQSAKSKEKPKTRNDALASQIGKLLSDSNEQKQFFQATIENIGKNDQDLFMEMIKNQQAQIEQEKLKIQEKEKQIQEKEKLLSQNPLYFYIMGKQHYFSKMSTETLDRLMIELDLVISRVAQEQQHSTYNSYNQSQTNYSQNSGGASGSYPYYQHHHNNSSHY